MQFPIEMVVELLMENASADEAGRIRIMLGGSWYDAWKPDDLRGYIREYLRGIEIEPGDTRS
jgi:hypothetical protein